MGTEANSILTSATSEVSPKQSKLDQVSNEKATAFHAGKIKQFLPTWETLTSDPFILKSVSGAEIQLNETPETKKIMLQTKYKEI